MLVPALTPAPKAKATAMHYWRKGMFKALQAAADAAEGIPAWRDYATYCRLRERGLRQQSLHSLEAFIGRLVDSDFEQRLAFVRWVMPRSDSTSDGVLLVPRPLYDRLVGPTLREWSQRRPTEAEPHFWLGMREHRREHLRHAVDLDPRLTEARVRLASYLLGDVEHAERIGRDVAGLDTTIREVCELIGGLPESDLKRELGEELDGYKRRYGIDGRSDRLPRFGEITSEMCGK
jgi:hypothetical protein